MKAQIAEARAFGETLRHASPPPGENPPPRYFPLLAARERKATPARLEFSPTARFALSRAGIVYPEPLSAPSRSRVVIIIYPGRGPRLRET